MTFVFPHFHTYETREDLAHALAASVAQALKAQLVTQETASLAVSGGRTPDLFFSALSAYPLPWSSIRVTLVDERWVPPSSPRSNEALVRQGLLRNKARDALFIPLYTSDHETPEEGCKTLNESLKKSLPLPFTAVVLGMGEDGHTASFFPGADQLNSALDPDTAHYVAPIRAQAAGEPRVTLTLPMILNTHHLFLHFEGAIKKRVYDQSLSEITEGRPQLPIGVVFQHTPIPPQVFWCP